MTSKQEKGIGWWMDSSTCICCDRPEEELEFVNFLDMRRTGKATPKPHLHNIILMMCGVCLNLYVADVSWVHERVEMRILAAQQNCKCETFFTTQSDTPIEMMHSRS